MDCRLAWLLGRVRSLSPARFQGSDPPKFFDEIISFARNQQSQYTCMYTAPGWLEFLVRGENAVFDKTIIDCRPGSAVG